MKSLINSSLGLLATRLVGIGLGLISTVLLSRVLTLESFGEFSFHYSTGMALAAFAHLGIPLLVNREIAKFAARGEVWKSFVLAKWASARLLLSVFLAALFLFGLGIAAPLGGVQNLSFGLFETIGISSFVALFVLAQVQRGAVNGIGRPFAASIPDEILRQMVFLFLIFIFATVSELDALGALALLIVAVAASVLVYSVMLFRDLRSIHSSERSSIDGSVAQWSRDMWPLFWASSLFALMSYTDIMMIGLMADAQDVALYRVATQIAVCSLLVMVALQEAAKPLIAKLYVLGHATEIKDISVHAARAQSLSAFTFVILFYFVGDDAIAIIFGEQYSDAFTIVIILASLRALAMLFGLGDITLKMSTYPRLSLWFTLVAAASNIGLNLALVPIAGAPGAAVATGLSWCLLSLLCWAGVKIKFGYRGDAFAKPRLQIYDFLKR